MAEHRVHYETVAKINTQKNFEILTVHVSLKTQ